jgi:hypothetical protein
MHALSLISSTQSTSAWRSGLFLILNNHSALKANHCVMSEHQGNLVDKTHDKAFAGHGEVPRASFMDDTVIDLPDYDEQGNNTNADNVVS